MHRFKPRRPSAGIVIAMVALIAAAGGTAGAKSLISGRDIRAHSITRRNIQDHTITARQLSRSLMAKRFSGASQSGAPGTKGDTGAAGADGAPGRDLTASDAKPAFPQQVDCRVELPPVNKNAVGDAAEDQDDSGRSMINFNEQNTIEMNRIVTVGNPNNPTDPTVTQTTEDKIELSCWQPKRTGKGDGVVITGEKLSLLRIDQNTNLNPDPKDPNGFTIGADAPIPVNGIRNFQFNNGDDRTLIKGIFQDEFDASVNGVTNPTKDQLATGIVDIPVDPTRTLAQCTAQAGGCHALPIGRYQLLAHVRTDKVRRSTDVDKLGRPTTQAPHVLPDENAEPLQSPTLLP